MDVLKVGDRVEVVPGMDVDRGRMTLRHQRDDGQWICDSDRGDRWTYGAHALRKLTEEEEADEEARARRWRQDVQRSREASMKGKG